MKIENAVVLVSGANRGIGLAFARELPARGARKDPVEKIAQREADRRNAG
jgi:NAD(P)-dependent dehydrogenase (short-subunit alcohol dehydrogenase family)